MSREDKRLKNLREEENNDNYENELDGIDREDEYENNLNEKYENILNSLQNNLIDYVNNNSLPLCEYLYIDEIHNFLDKF